MELNTRLAPAPSGLGVIDENSYPYNTRFSEYDSAGWIVCLGQRALQLSRLTPVSAVPLPAPSGNLVNVSTVNQLRNAVNSANPGDTILVADGTYNLDGVYLRIDVPNVTVRSQSGNREAVILDGNYITTEIFQIVASNVTIADLTLREAYDHPIHVSTGDDNHTLNTLIYNVHIIDPGQQAIKINPSSSGYYTDDGTIACSHIELTDAGRPHIRDNCYTGGIDAHQSRGWVIRDNQIEGFWCDSGSFRTRYPPVAGLPRYPHRAKCIE